MKLQDAHRRLGWPEPRRVLKPSGEATAVMTGLANAKIAGNLSTEAKVRAGLLFLNPSSDRTEAPFAVVCEFSRPVSEEVLVKAHRLAWNFAAAPLLITLEPSRVLAWSCFVPPVEKRSVRGAKDLGRKLVAVHFERSDDPLCGVVERIGPETDALEALQWVRLAAGEHFRTHPRAFKPEGRLDSILVDNLVFVRNHIRDKLRLSEARCHDLLARLIFIQFLFQRKDSRGKPALDAAKLRSLFERGVLRNMHESFESLLLDYDDAYAFFGWLNGRFNGDLFPGKGTTPEDREKEWTEEQKDVRPDHLCFLARFISGKEDLPKGQGLLWRHYAFDTIPLELISSIYEMFVGPAKKDKAYYTKAHLVDFMLDAVLPWAGKTWELRVLDPSCGSGIFLVKTFQRLVHRWRNAHGTDPKPRQLKDILANQIYGVDINPEAIRVAAFSLYLAFCDELDPRHYWSQKKLFPPLRGGNLIHSDFFADDIAPFRTKADSGTFDLVVGNAPWGKTTAKEGKSRARIWARDHEWKPPGNDHGPVFLAKAAQLCKPDGWVSMIQPGGLLLNRMAPAKEFRRKLFTRYRFEEVVHLGAIRKVLFAAATGPACVATFQPAAPAPDDEFAYVAPKLHGTAEDRQRIVIEPHDIHFVHHEEAVTNDLIWSVLMWGGRRDLELIERLSRFTTIGKLKAQGKLATREGFIRGGGEGVKDPDIVGRKFLWDREFPCSPFERLKAEILPTNYDPKVHRKDRDRLLAFDPPQVLFKQSWRSDENRFQAVHVEPDEKGRGALCSGSYVSFRALDENSDVLAWLWLLLNSSVAGFWFPLAGGKFANFIPEGTESELRQMPVIPFPSDKLAEVVEGGFRAIDEEVARRLNLNDTERILVRDMHEVVLPDSQRQAGRPPGFEAVAPKTLEDYADAFRKVLVATFGNRQSIGATVYEPPKENPLPLSIVAIHFNWVGKKVVRRQRVASAELFEEIQACHKLFLERAGSGIAFQRVIEVFKPVDLDGATMPTLFLIKPSQRRYWLQSIALRDADRLGSLVARMPGAVSI